MIKIQLKYQLLILLFLLFINQYAQKEQRPFGIKETFHYGFIAPHRPIVNELLEGHTKAYELSFYKNTLGKKQWQQLYNYPTVGLSLIYLDLANPAQLGKSFGCFPYLSFLVTDKKISWEIKFGAGVGYIEKPFDKTTNYKNLAIGSSMNGLININSQWTTRLTDDVNTSLGVSVIHFSNGSFKRPNLGINIFSLNLGVAYHFGKPQEQHTQEMVDRERSWSKNFSIAVGLKEIPPVEGPKYFVSTYSFNLIKTRSNKSSFGAGLDVFYNTSLTHLIAQDSTKKQSSMDNFRGGITLIYSLDFGQFSTLFQMGGYLFAKEKSSGVIYHRVQTRYAINDQLFFNLGLKTHYVVADFVEVGLGYRFK
ncbi:MAG: acyloxyacyl hydrolase [Vicingus serpentipes]|nr:acyloxyacyl hydrolase [Vicingus serpentipes]